jgi:hypothetical protein
VEPGAFAGLFRLRQPEFAGEPVVFQSTTTEANIPSMRRVELLLSNRGGLISLAC